ncbi:MAG TPA: methyltransferase domain-containing protein [Gammaproteobacteria bacterium]|nr:methyltransferase domain-containing protein [Gammaproteobacteria bacterium]
MQTGLDTWFQGRAGGYLLRQERAVLAEALPTVFGFYLLQAGAWGSAHGLLQASPIRSRTVLDMRASDADLRADPASLPFAGDALDAVLLPHTLERAADPHRMLREAERVLTGEGHIIVLGFHPWGPWGLRQQFFDPPPWAGRHIGAGRLQEWLAVLGFETLNIRQYLFRPPFTRDALLVKSRFLDRWRWRPTAGAYMLVARKRVLCVTPLRRQRARPQRAFSGAVKPTTREMG